MCECVVVAMSYSGFYCRYCGKPDTLCNGPPRFHWSSFPALCPIHPRIIHDRSGSSCWNIALSRVDELSVTLNQPGYVNPARVDANTFLRIWGFRAMFPYRDSSADSNIATWTELFSASVLLIWSVSRL